MKEQAPLKPVRFVSEHEDNGTDTTVASGIDFKLSLKDDDASCATQTA